MNETPTSTTTNAVRPAMPVIAPKAPAAQPTPAATANATPSAAPKFPRRQGRKQS